ILHGFLRFDLREEMGSLIGLREEHVPIADAVVHATAADVEAARSDGWKLAEFNNLPGLGGGIDHWDDHYSRADLQGAQHVMSLAIGHAHGGNPASRLDRHAERFDFAETGWPVLHLDPYGFKADFGG